MRPMMLAAAIAAAALSAPAAQAAELTCNMTFNMHGWSLVYKHSKGTGEVRCSDGSHMRVNLDAKGGGLTAGKTRIYDGVGEFTHVNSINDVTGTYAAAEADAAAGEAAKAQVMTKGPVSLALKGKGEGVSLGLSLGGFTIRKVGRVMH